MSLNHKKHIYFRGRGEKLEIIANLFADILKEGRILDVGCDNSYLKKLISNPSRYRGIDKYGNPDIKKDISDRLPFKKESFDTVLALDVLEHVDDIHFLFDELCRVSKKWIIISLPNIYEWRFRISFLFGKLLTGKYGLPEDSPQDRHRWLFSLSEAKNFTKKRAGRNGFETFQEVICFYKYNKVLPRIITQIGSHLGRRFQNLFASQYFIVLKRKI